MKIIESIEARRQPLPVGESSEARRQALPVGESSEARRHIIHGSDQNSRDINAEAV